MYYNYLLVSLLAIIESKQSISYNRQAVYNFGLEGNKIDLYMRKLPLLASRELSDQDKDITI